MSGSGKRKQASAPAQKAKKPRPNTPAEAGAPEAAASTPAAAAARPAKRAVKAAPRAVKAAPRAPSDEWAHMVLKRAVKALKEGGRETVADKVQDIITGDKNLLRIDARS